MMCTQVTYVDIDPGKHHMHLTDPAAVLPHLAAFLQV
jgi:hypothetical protein